MIWNKKAPFLSFFWGGGGVEILVLRKGYKCSVMGRKVAKSFLLPDQKSKAMDVFGFPFRCAIFETKRG